MRSFIYLLAGSVVLIGSVAAVNFALESAPRRQSNATSGKVKTYHDQVTGTTTAEVTVRLPGQALDGFAYRGVYKYSKAELEAYIARLKAQKASWFGWLRSPDPAFPKISFGLLALAKDKKFAATDRLILLIDGERWEPKFEYKYSVDWKTTGSTFEEILTTTTAAQLQKIADAEKVSVTLGQMSFELTGEQRAPLGELAAGALQLQEGAP